MPLIGGLTLSKGIADGGSEPLMMVSGTTLLVSSLLILFFDKD